MISIGWLLLIGGVGVIFLLVAGALFKENEEGPGAFFTALGLLVFLALSIVFFLKGTGYTSDSSRLRMDQTYWVVGYVESPRIEEDIIVLEDYRNKIFCITTPSEYHHLAYAKTVRIIKDADGNQVLRAHIIDPKDVPRGQKESDDPHHFVPEEKPSPLPQGGIR